MRFGWIAAGLFCFAIQASVAQKDPSLTVGGWQLQDVAKVTATAETVSTRNFHPDHWYSATVPGTVLTSLVNDGVYPEPLYGENMRNIPESLNKTSYWYRTVFEVPKAYRGRHVWLHFGGINYSATIWVNGRQQGTLRGAFIRGDFDITASVKPGHQAVIAVLVSPQPHPGVPHEHTQANGLGLNGGETAIDGPTFLSTIGWDWLNAVRDRDTGLWLPVTLNSTGPVVVKDTSIRSELADGLGSADLHVSGQLQNLEAKAVHGTITGSITLNGSQNAPIIFHQPVTVDPNGTTQFTVDPATIAALHLDAPKLWWPNGYGSQNLYTLELQFTADGKLSSDESEQFGIRRIEYQRPGSEDLTIVVNGVPVMVRGGNWGLDEAMKRLSPERLDAEFRMHAMAHLNMIRNWVGQSTSPLFYQMADKYGILLWDEFFQPNPLDGPNPTDIPTYLANVRDKVEHYRNHPSIAVWCARNEGYPPDDLNAQLKAMMSTLDPSRLYQANSADGRGVSSHGPYYWRSPRLFYPITESFKTETGSVSVPTLESIQGMMPEKDWEHIDDDWAAHDMAAGAQRGNEYPQTLAERYGHIRNLADFTRKAQLANYEAFRGMYEGRNAQMFTATTGVLTWMSAPAQPSFVWQLYHYDLEPNAALFAAQKAGEPVHIQMNEATRELEVVNNRPEPLIGLKATVRVLDLNMKETARAVYKLSDVAASSTQRIGPMILLGAATPIYFIRLDLTDAKDQSLSSNLYWKQVAQDQLDGLAALPPAEIDATGTAEIVGEQTKLTVILHNHSQSLALMTHLQLHRGANGPRVLPVFYSDNYVSLLPGESRTITVEAATAHLEGQNPVLQVDGWNVSVVPHEGSVGFTQNVNADPQHWPATSLVPWPYGADAH